MANSWTKVDTIKQAHLYIKGDVIGVGFRAWARYVARKMGVNGWVKNAEPDVEALLQAEEPVLLSMIERIKEGPPVADVKDVDVKWEPLTEPLPTFEILK